MNSRRPHMLTTLRRPWAVWLALCMALLGALAPTVSHARVWAQGGQAPLVEICTNTGPSWMALSGTTEPAPSDPTPTEVWDHCPFCLLLADRMAPPPQPPILGVAAYGHAGVPAPPPTLFLPAQVLAAAHPRGPPAP